MSVASHTDRWQLFLWLPSLLQTLLCLISLTLHSIPASLAQLVDEQMEAPGYPHLAKLLPGPFSLMLPQFYVSVLGFKFMIICSQLENFNSTASQTY